MFTRFFNVALAAAAALVIFATPSSAAPAASPSAKASPATHASPATKEKTVEGTVEKWDDKTQTFQTKATVQTWTFSFDKSKLKKSGKVAVGARVRITYHAEGKVNVADKVEAIAKK